MAEVNFDTIGYKIVYAEEDWSVFKLADLLNTWCREHSQNECYAVSDSDMFRLAHAMQGFKYVGVTRVSRAAAGAAVTQMTHIIRTNLDGNISIGTTKGIEAKVAAYMVAYTTVGDNAVDCAVSANAGMWAADTWVVVGMEEDPNRSNYAREIAGRAPWDVIVLHHMD